MHNSFLRTSDIQGFSRMHCRLQFRTLRHEPFARNDGIVLVIIPKTWSIRITIKSSFTLPSVHTIFNVEIYKNDLVSLLTPRSRIPNLLHVEGTIYSINKLFIGPVLELF